MQDKTPHPKKKSKQLSATEKRRFTEEVLSLIGELPPVTAEAYRTARKDGGPNYPGWNMSYSIIYTSCRDYIVARLLLDGEETFQAWYNRQGFLLPVQIPCRLLEEKGVPQPEGPKAGNIRRTLPTIMTLAGLNTQHVTILEDSVLRMRGITQDIENARNPVQFIQLLFTDNQFETLVKLGFPKDKLFDYITAELRESWYRQTLNMLNAGKASEYDLTTWRDYLRLLKLCGKDYNNPRIYLPNDLQTAHEKMVILQQNRYEKELRKRREEDDRQDFLGLDQKKLRAFEQGMSRFSHITLTGRTFTVSTLSTIEDHYQDSVRLHHCLFHNKYYEKKDSVILRVVKNENPDRSYADAELNYRTGEILQLYGNLNRPLPAEEDAAVKALIRANLQKYLDAGKKTSKRALLAVEKFKPDFA